MTEQKINECKHFWIPIPLPWWDRPISGAIPVLCAHCKLKSYIKDN